jgi:hypothetical protein
LEHPVLMLVGVVSFMLEYPHDASARTRFLHGALPSSSGMTINKK